MNKKQLIARCKELGIDTSVLNTNAEREAAIQAKEAELAKEQVKSEEVNQEVESSGKTSSEETGTESAQPGTESPEVVKKEEESGNESAETGNISQESETDKPQEKTPEVKTQEENSQDEESEEEETGIYTDNRGRKFRFTEKAPKTLNIDGHPMTQAEILQSEEVISELVHGNNSFLTQIN